MRHVLFLLFTLCLQLPTAEPSFARSCQACMNACANAGGEPGDCFFACVSKGSCKKDEPNFLHAFDLSSATGYRLCQAELLGDSKEDSLCREMNESLHQLSREEWNEKICGKLPSFRAGSFQFRSSETSDEMEANEGSILCVWEVRKNAEQKLSRF